MFRHLFNHLNLSLSLPHLLHSALLHLLNYFFPYLFHQFLSSPISPVHSHSHFTYSFPLQFHLFIPSPISPASPITYFFHRLFIPSPISPISSLTSLFHYQFPLFLPAPIPPISSLINFTYFFLHLFLPSPICSLTHFTNLFPHLFHLSIPLTYFVTFKFPPPASSISFPLLLLLFILFFFLYLVPSSPLTSHLAIAQSFSCFLSLTLFIRLSFVPSFHRLSVCFLFHYVFEYISASSIYFCYISVYLSVCMYIRLDVYLSM